jgi:hypothetical protein
VGEPCVASGSGGGGPARELERARPAALFTPRSARPRASPPLPHIPFSFFLLPTTSRTAARDTTTRKGQRPALAQTPKRGFPPPLPPAGLTSHRPILPLPQTDPLARSPLDHCTPPSAIVSRRRSRSPKGKGPTWELETCAGPERKGALSPSSDRRQGARKARAGTYTHTHINAQATQPLRRARARARKSSPQQQTRRRRGRRRASRRAIAARTPPPPPPLLPTPPIATTKG